MIGTKNAAALLLFSAFSLTLGCKFASAPTPENFTKGISKFLLDHPDCLYQTALRFPYETSDKDEIKQLDSLVSTKLLSKGTEPAIHITRYTVTDYGKKSAPRFCYGFRHVSGVESFTPPAKAASGFNESKVVYRYTLEDVPVWAKGRRGAKSLSKDGAGRCRPLTSHNHYGADWRRLADSRLEAVTWSERYTGRDVSVLFSNLPDYRQVPWSTLAQTPRGRCA